MNDMPDNVSPPRVRMVAGPVSCGRCGSKPDCSLRGGVHLIEWGNTRVICGVTIEEIVPRWMKEQNVTGGWITAEYSMAAAYSTLQRKPRDILKRED